MTTTKPTLWTAEMRAANLAIASADPDTLGDKWTANLAIDVVSRAREFTRQPIGPMTPLQAEYFCCYFQRCCDYTLSKHPTVAALLEAARGS